MGIRIAIPLFGSEVAPRFCFTPQVLLADLEEGEIKRRVHVDVSLLGWAQRLEKLSEQDVDLLICGGFNRRFLPTAQQLGLKVIWGYSGPAEEILQAVISKDLSSLENRPRCSRNPNRGRGQGRGRMNKWRKKQKES